MGALIYMGVEVAYDNSSHRSMGLIGGLSFIIGGAIDSRFKHWSVRRKSFWISTVIIILEFFGGLIFNSDYSIWDYRNMKIGKIPLHIKGQVCIHFWLIWFLIMGPLILWLDDKLEDEEIDIFKYYKRLIK